MKFQKTSPKSSQSPDLNARQKNDIFARYQVPQANESSKHGLILFSTLQKFNHSNKEPIFPYKEILTRKEPLKIEKSVRSHSVQKASTHRAELRNRGSSYGNIYHKSTETLPTTGNFHFKEVYAIKSPPSTERIRKKEKQTEPVDILPAINGLKRDNQDAFLNIIVKNKKDNQQKDKVIKNMKSKPLDLPPDGSDIGSYGNTKYGEFKGTRSKSTPNIQSEKLFNKSKTSLENKPNIIGSPYQELQNEPDMLLEFTPEDGKKNEILDDKLEALEDELSHFNLDPSPEKHERPERLPRVRKDIRINSIPSDDGMADSLKSKTQNPNASGRETQKATVTYNIPTEEPKTDRKQGRLRKSTSQNSPVKDDKRAKLMKRFLGNYQNPLYKKGVFVVDNMLPGIPRQRPKISKKFKNSVRIQYPDVHVEDVTGGNADLSFAETSIDTDTYEYYRYLHKEYFHISIVNRAKIFDSLMKMDIRKNFQGIPEEVAKYNVLLLLT